MTFDPAVVKRVVDASGEVAVQPSDIDDAADHEPHGRHHPHSHSHYNYSDKEIDAPGKKLTLPFCTFTPSGLPLKPIAHTRKESYSRWPNAEMLRCIV